MSISTEPAATPLATPPGRMGRAKSVCTLIVNGKPVKAHIGDTLVDAALGSRIVIPHDCCSGQCDTCRVTVISGTVDDQGTAERDTVMGCQATVTGDAEIHFDPVPLVKKVTGTVSAIEQLDAFTYEVKVQLARPLAWLPGQYVKLAFAGFPSRDYSPTFGIDGEADPDVMVFQVKRYDNGVVSSALGGRIGIGHRVSIRGPFGHAFLRRGEGRIFMLSTGTGFAPVWAMGLAARLGQPHRELTIIAGAREKTGLYFAPAAQWLRERGAQVTLTAGDGDGEHVRKERPGELLPQLTERDTVYVCGAPKLVEAVKDQAFRAGAACYADPFLPSDGKVPLVSRVIGMFRRKPSLEKAA